ncbi:MICOS complex subunit MIC13 [Latimeria chalumnae]|uniref:MICOS complex subunit MIC13 n=1 Tax=Latimeria chalumnae TaxID=7897 RepID=H3A7Q7_LATCH|nr:PREDICTED: MICOS complex subunit MIC13 [Latimeria chalumnae]|eukprot:XP_006008154.1 PREDICTED: MICOS complex subunit MIC13 [Latimeria chalumnae]
MATRVLPLVKLLSKIGLAGGAVYIVYDQELLSNSEKGSEALHKAKEAIPLAVDEWRKYFGWELPAAPKMNFSLCEFWNSGVRRSMSALSVAPTRAGEYTQQGWQYMKNLTK